MVIRRSYGEEDIDNHLDMDRRGSRPGDAVISADRAGIHERDRCLRANVGHLARGTHPRQLSRTSGGSAAHPGLPDAAWRAHAGSEANIIKLPNISASIPQLMDAIKELQSKGYSVPDYPENPKDDAEKAIQERYSKVLGSAVNPVIRQGNADRRSPASVKEFARKHPIKMGAWSPDSKSHVAHMTDGDFFGSEKSVTMRAPAGVRYEFVAADGEVSVLKENVPLPEGSILDTSVMNVRALRSFYEEQIEDAKRQGVLLSLHLKATMMKVSDPVLFGHAVSVYFSPVFAKHAETFKQIGVNPDNGLGDLYAKIQSLPDAKKEEIEADIKAVYDMRPPLAMVDSDRGITNLHSPNLVIIDASMPAMIRDSGKMWGPDGKLHDTKAMLPDRCYSTLYKTIVEDCKKHGAFDQATMGSVPNVGLMAQEAEEYGSHDKTFHRRRPGGHPRRRRGDRRYAARAERGRRGCLPVVPHDGCRDPRLGKACGELAPGSRARPPCSGWTKPARTTVK